MAASYCEHCGARLAGGEWCPKCAQYRSSDAPASGDPEVERKRRRVQQAKERADRHLSEEIRAEQDLREKERELEDARQRAEFHREERKRLEQSAADRETHLERLEAERRRDPEPLHEDYRDPDSGGYVAGEPPSRTSELLPPPIFMSSTRQQSPAGEDEARNLGCPLLILGGMCVLGIGLLFNGENPLGAIPVGLIAFILWLGSRDPR